MRFAKMHGLGNDFVLLDFRSQPGASAPSAQRAAELCDRHRGIGADGVLTLLDGERFVIHNAQVEVEMGEAEVFAERELAGGFRAVPVSTGNPHRVVFTEGDLRVVAARHGPALCRAEDANIEFVSRLGPARYAAVVWERGAGLTQACGTGACAVAAAAISRGDVDRSADVIVELPGGALSIRRDPMTGQLLMRGPAQLVFTGEVPD
jgi:diaminopimelate epimerase